MAANRTSVAMRRLGAFATLAAASAVAGLSAPAQAAAPGARTSAMTTLEEALIVTPDQDPAESRQPPVAYLRLTEDGWQVDFLPSAMPRVGPLPVVTTTVDSALEDLASNSVAPYLPVLRVDF